MLKTWMYAAAVTSSLCFALACGDDDDANPSASGGAGNAGATNEGGSAGEAAMCEPPTPPDGDELAIVGTYSDEFGTYTVTSSEWSSGDTVFHISQFDNSEHWIVAQNDQGNSYNACAWSRFDWLEMDGKLYECQTVYNADSEEAALSHDAADASDLENGCGGFPWSELTPQ